MKVSILDSIPDDKWNALKIQDKTFFSSNEWIQTLCKTYPNFSSYIIEFLFKKDIFAYLPCIRDKNLDQERVFFLISLFDGTYGGIISNNSLSEYHIGQIVDYLTNSDIQRIYIYPNPLSKVALPSSCRKNMLYTHIINLENGFEYIWNNSFSGKTRNQIRKAEKSGVKIYVDCSLEALDTYYKMYIDSGKRWGIETPYYPQELFINILQLQSKNVKLWLAKVDMKPVAGAFLFYGGTQVIYWSGAFYKDYAWWCPNNLLLKEAILDACQQGYRYFNMGGSGSLDGVRKFKEGFGAKRVDYYWYQIDNINR